MKTSLKLALSLLLSFAAIPGLSASTLLWDANATSSGVSDGAGTSWITANQWWNSSTNADVTWSSATPDDAIIGNWGTGGTISTGGNITLNTLKFNGYAGNYSVTSAAPQTMQINSGLTVNFNAFASTSNSNTAVTLGNGNLSLVLGGNQTWTNYAWSTPNGTAGTVNFFGLVIGGGVTTAASSGTTTLQVNGLGDTGFTGIISDNGGGKVAINKTGNGTISFTNANTFTGGFTLGSGVAYLQNAAGFGGSTNVVALNGGTVLTAAALGNVVNNLTIGGNVNFNNNSNNLTLTGTVDLTGGTRTITTNTTGQYSTSLTMGGVISNGGFTKDGAGSLTLNGAAVNTFTGGLTVNNGSLTVNYSNAAALTNNLIDSGNTLTLNGGTLTIQGKGSTTNAQTFNGVALNGAANLTGIIGTGGTVNLTLGTITRTAPGTINFTKPATGNIAVSNSNDSTGILGAWATVGGSDYATVTAGNIGSLGAAANNTETTWDTTGVSNLTFSTATALTASRSVNTLREGGNITLSLGAAATAFNMTTNGIMSSSGGQTLTISRNATATGTLVIGASGELDITGGGALNLQVPITGNGNLVKAGAGTTTISTYASSFTGSTYVTAGTLSLQVASALGSANPTVNGGTLSSDVANGLSGNTVTVNDGGTVTSVNSVANALNNATFNVNNGGLITAGYSSALAGSAISLAGGTLQLTVNGNTSYGGAVSVTNSSIDSTIRVRGGNGTQQSVGSLTFNNGARLIIDQWDAYFGVTGALTMTGNGTIDLHPSIDPTTGNVREPNPASIASQIGSITGSGILTKTGYFGLQINSASGFTGSIVVDGGGLFAGGVSALNGASLVTINNGSLYAGSAGTAIANSLNGITQVTVNSGGTIYTSGGTSQTLAGTLISLNGGALRVDGSNFATTYAGGNIRLDANSQISLGGGNSTVDSLDTLTFTNGTTLTLAVTGDSTWSIRNLTLPSGGGTATVSNLSTQTKAFALGGDSTNTGTITYTGATSLILNGANTNNPSTVLRGILSGGANTLTITPTIANSFLGDSTYALVGTGGIAPAAGTTIKSGVTGNTINGVLNLATTASTVYEMNNFNLVVGTVTGGNGTGGNINNNGGSAKTLVIGLDNGTGTYDGSITANTASRIVLAKIGSGTQTLGISGATTNSFTGGVWALGGILNLDFTQGTAPAADIINATNALNLMGGTLKLTGGDAQQTFASTTLQPGFSTVDASAMNNAAKTLVLGSISNLLGQNGAAVNFVLPTAGNITTSTAVTNGILGQNAFVGGNDYAIKSGANIAALNNTTITNESAWASGNVSIDQTALLTLTASRTPNTIRNIGTAPVTIDLGASGANTLTPLGILNAGTGLLTIQRTGGTGSVQLTGGNALVINTGANGVTISAPITSGDGSSKLVKVGSGTLTLSGNNGANSGATLVIDQGTVKLGSANALNTATAGSYMPVTFASGGGTTATLDLAGNSVSIGAIGTASASINGNTTLVDGNNIIDNSVNLAVTLNVTNGGTFDGYFTKSGGSSGGITLNVANSNVSATQTLNLVNFTGNNSAGLASITIGANGKVNVSNTGRSGVGASMSPAQMQQALGSAAINVNSGGAFFIQAPSAAWGSFVPTNTITVANGGTFGIAAGVPINYNAGSTTLQSGATLDSSLAAITFSGISTLNLPTAGALLFNATNSITFGNGLAGTTQSTIAYPTFTGTMAFGGTGSSNITTSAATTTSGAQTLAFNQTGGGSVSLNGLTLAGDLTVAGGGNAGFSAGFPTGSAGSLGTISESGGARSLTVNMSPNGVVSVNKTATGWTGGTTVTGGVLSIAGGGATQKMAGSNGITLNGGGIRDAGSGSGSTWQDSVSVGVNGGTIEEYSTNSGSSLILTGALTGSGPLTLRYGGAAASQQGIISLAPTSASAYSGPITIAMSNGRGYVQFNNNSLNSIASNGITVSGGVAFAVDTFSTLTGNIAKFNTNSNSILMLDNINTNSINLSSGGLNKDIRLGSYNSLTYSGTLTPNTSTYNFTPTNFSTLTLATASQLTGGNNLDVRAGAVFPTAIDPTGGSGVLSLTALMDYSGTTVVAGTVRSGLNSTGSTLTGTTLSVGTGGKISASTNFTIEKGAVLQVAGTNGQITSTNPTFAVRGGGTFRIGDSSTASNNNGQTDRVSNGATITLGGTMGYGTLQLAFGSTGAVTETLKSLTVNRGENQISTTNTAAGTLALTFGDGASTVYTRTAGGTVNISNSAGFTTNFTSAPTGSSVSGSGGAAILVGAFLNNSGFASATTTVGAPTYTVQNAAGSWAAGQNIDTSGGITGTTAAGSASINSLRAVNGGTVTIGTSASDSLTISSGMMLFGSGGPTINGPGSITSGNGQDLVINMTGGNSSIAAKITGSIALTLTNGISGGTGGGNFTISNAANDFTGINVYGDRLLISNAGAWGNAGAINISSLGAVISYTANTNKTLASGFTITAASPGGGTFMNSGTGTLTVQGAVTLNGGLNVSGISNGTVVADGTLDLQGAISGEGSIGVGYGNHARTLFSNADNSGWTGGLLTTANGTASGVANIFAYNGNSLGTGLISLGRTANLYFDTNAAGATTLNQNIYVNASSSISFWGLGSGLSTSGGTAPLTLAGTVVGNSGLTFQGTATDSSHVSELVLNTSVATGGTPTSYSFGTATNAQNFVNGQGSIQLGVTGFTGLNATTGTSRVEDGTGANSAVVNGALGYLRFNGAQSFLPGSVGPGYISAIHLGGDSTTYGNGTLTAAANGSTGGANGLFGYLLTGGATAVTYALPEGKSFVIGSLGTGTQIGGTLGSSGTGTNTAILTGSPKLAGFAAADVNIQANAAGDTQQLNLLARNSGDTFQLGTVGTAVVFSPTYGDSGVTSSVTLMSTRTGATTLNIIGAGTVEFVNTRMNNIGGATDSAKTGFTLNVNSGTLKYTQVDTGSDSYAAVNVASTGVLSGAGTIMGSLNYTSSSNSTFAGAIAGTANTLTMNNATSTLTLSGANTYTGTTTVTAGTLELAKSGGQAIGLTTSLAVNTSGTLLLSQSNQINNSATVTLGGGKIQLGSGISEGDASTVGVGALTLTDNSTIDFGTGLASLIHFADSSAAIWNSKTLSIWNWNSGSDALYFGTSNTALTPGQLSEISFYSDAGTSLIGVGTFSGSDGLVTAVPEPGTSIAGVALLGLAAWRERRRIFKILGLVV